MAGDVLVATRAEDSRAFVQFSKTPFPFLVGQIADDQWEVEFPAQHQRYSGHGNPPTRLIWLYLPRVLRGEPPPKNWDWKQDASGWRLENTATQEAVEGVFTQ
jgi:hypothetical protein